MTIGSKHNTARKSKHYLGGLHYTTMLALIIANLTVLLLGALIADVLMGRSLANLETMSRQRELQKAQAAQMEQLYEWLSEEYEDRGSSLLVDERAEDEMLTEDDGSKGNLRIDALGLSCYDEEACKSWAERQCDGWRGVRESYLWKTDRGYSPRFGHDTIFYQCRARCNGILGIGSGWFHGEVCYWNWRLGETPRPTPVSVF